jgi:adenine-specific DNA-methyltransferase
VRYEGRLELTWTNKDQRLLADEGGGYTWVPPGDFRVSEVRLLDDVATVGEVGRERAKDNVLIRGDALHALTSLVELPEFAKEHVGKVRLCYIDPPFNTGQAFAQYDDALEHSVWLTMLRDRLVQIKQLLSDDGSVWVHLDDAEVHRARCVLDEVFGAQNYLATPIWQKIHARNNSARAFSTDHDYMVVYGREARSWRRNLLDRTAASDADFWNPDDDPRGLWRRSDLTAAKAYAEGHFTVRGPNGDEFTPRAGRPWGVSRETFERLRDEGRLWWGVDGRSFPFRKRFRDELGGLVPTTVWEHEEVGNNREAKGEIAALFDRDTLFATPKPERLMERVIHIASDPGDLVLDCFLGSGTTAAVAQKMGRRWVGIEQSPDTIATFALPRLTRVVNGEDPGGATKSAGWDGGGGFRVLEVAPSMFVDDDGVVVLADWAVDSRLAEATAAQLGYEYLPEPPFSGRKGRVRLAVIDGLVNDGVVRAVVANLGEEERVTVCGTAIDPACRSLLRELAPGSTLRKIPASLLDEYRTSRRTRLHEAIAWAEVDSLLDAAASGGSAEPATKA